MAVLLGMLGDVPVHFAWLEFFPFLPLPLPLMNSSTASDSSLLTIVSARHEKDLTIYSKCRQIIKVLVVL